MTAMEEALAGEYFMPLLENLAGALGRPESARFAGEPPRDWEMTVPGGKYRLLTRAAQ